MQPCLHSSISSEKRIKIETIIANKINYLQNMSEFELKNSHDEKFTKACGCKNKRKYCRAIDPSIFC